LLPMLAPGDAAVLAHILRTTRTCTRHDILIA
jgi:hypothetical protein